MKLSLSQVGLPELALDEFLELAARFGFPGVSVTLASLEEYGFDAGLRRLEHSGLEVSCIYGAGGFALDRPDAWEAQVKSSVRNVELAARTSSDLLLLTTGPAPGLSYEEAEQRFRQAVAPVLDAAERHEMRLALEPLNTCRVDLTFLHRVEDALDLVRDIGAPHLGVCFELNAAWVERNLYTIIRERLERVFIVQLNDQCAENPAPPVRVPLGEGVIPLRRILAAFAEAGYAGYYDLELLGPAIEAIGPEPAIRRSLEFLERL